MTEFLGSPLIFHINMTDSVGALIVLARIGIKSGA